MSDLSQPVLEAMDELNHRVREVQFTRGILGVIAVAIGVLLSLMLIDLIVSPPERWMQFGLSAAGLAIVLFFIWRWLLRPGAKRLKPLEIARHLEAVHPELEERLSSAIELTRHPDPGVSQSMVQSVVQGALADVENIDPDQEITSRSVRPFRNAALLVAALMVVIFAVQPGKSFRLAGRTLMPWMDIGNVWSGGMNIQPGDLVALRGTPIDLTMQMEVQRRPPPVFLERSGPDGTRSRERMPLLHTSQSSDGGGQVQHFTLHLPEADESFRYRIASGRRLSAWHDIEVIDRPSAEDLKIEVEWPAYTGWGRVAETNELVRAMVGSIIHVELVPNKEIGQFGLWYGDPERAERLAESTRTMARWSFELTPDHAGPVIARMRDRHGFEGEASRPFDPVPDSAPTVDLLLPLESKLRLRADASLHLGAYVEDDNGVAGMEIVVEGVGEPVRIAVPDAFAATAIPGEAAAFDIGAVLKLRDLDLSNTRALKVWLEAWDISPEAQRGRSRPVFIGIDLDADSQLAQEIERQAARAREELDKAIKAVQEAKAAAKNGSPREVAERTRKADAETRELAAALSESMMNQLGEEARETADAFTDPAVQDAERVPLTDSQAQENALRQQVAQNMSEAEKALEEMKKDLAELKEQLEQLADIKELADRERGIAEAAAALKGGSKSAGEKAAGEQAGVETANSEPPSSDAFDPLQAQQADATSQIGEAMQKDDAAMAGQRQAAAQSSAELAEAASELAAMEESLQAVASGREGAADGSKTGTQDSLAGSEASASNGSEALRDALQDAIGAQQKALAGEAASVEAADTANTTADSPSGEGAEPAGEQAEGMPNTAGAETGSNSQAANPSGEQAGSAENGEPSGSEAEPSPDGSPSKSSGEREPTPDGQANGEGETGNTNGQDPQGANPNGSPASNAAQAASEAAEQMDAGDLDAARAAAAQAAAALDQSNAPGSDELAERQQQLAEQMDALAAGDLQDALAKTRETMAARAGDLAEQAKSFAAAEAAAGQNAQAGQALEAGQQLAAAADAEQQAAQGSQDRLGTGEGEPSQEQKDAEQAAAEQLRAALETLQALAQQAAEQAAGDQAGATSGKNPLADALESAAQASTTDSPADMEQGASEAADALDLAAQQAQQKLGLSNSIPGLPQAGRSEGMPVPMPGQPSGEPGSQPGSQQPEKAGGKPGQMAQNKGEGQQEGEAGDGDSPEGGGAPDQDFSAVPPALEKLGVSASDWSRLRGRVDSRTGRTRTDGVPAEYRDLVERYFESIASER